MPSGIDHVVLTVNSLDEATKSFEALGFTARFGGHHEHRPSSNVLVAFQDGSYIELIGFRTSDPIDDPWWRLHQMGEGLVDHALRSNDVASDAARLKAAGFAVRGPIPGGRNRPDGARVEWSNVRIDAVSGARAPFIIEDVTSRDLRVPSGEPARHANGVTRLVGITTVVDAIEPAGKLFEAVTGVAGTPSVSPIEGAGPALRFTLGEQWLELVEPAAGSNPLRAYLERRGSGPYEFVVGTADAVGTAVTVVHGARVRIP